MKLLLNIPKGVKVADVEALINGSQAARGEPVIPMARIDDPESVPKQGVGFAFGVLLVPMERIEGLTLDRTKGASRDGGVSKFLVETTAQEYAILQYIVGQLDAQKPKAPF